MEYVIAIGLGAALGVLMVRTEDGWLPTVAVFVALGWCIVAMWQTSSPPAGIREIFAAKRARDAG